METTEKQKQRYPAGSLEELTRKGRSIVKVKGMEVGLFLVDGQVQAWRNVCPHAAAPVCEGRVCGTRLPSDVYEYVYGKDQGVLRCPWHGWEFDLKTGRHLAEEDRGVKLRGFETEIVGDDIFVLIG